MQLVSYSVLLCSALHLLTINAQMLFHGTSIMIQPAKGRDPSMASYESANFYCYFSLEHLQYVSFGWFLGGDPENIDGSKCQPRPDSYGWWEYSSSANCTSDGSQCTVHAINFKTENATHPFIDENYVVLKPFEIGNSSSETMHISYFDKPGGAHAVGKRRILEDGDECQDAYDTITEIVKERNVPIVFNLTNPCLQSRSMSKQFQVKLGAR